MQQEFSPVHILDLYLFSDLLLQWLYVNTEITVLHLVLGVIALLVYYYTDKR